jgi:hypothetical protein
MTMPLDAKQASVEIAGYIKNVLEPPRGGASLSDILGAYIFKSVLREAGYVIVPIAPNVEMELAYRKGWFRSFADRYGSLLSAGWPESKASVPPPRADR